MVFLSAVVGHLIIEEPERGRGLLHAVRGRLTFGSKPPPG
jgi:hypothetical protein